MKIGLINIYKLILSGKYKPILYQAEPWPTVVVKRGRKEYGIIIMSEVVKGPSSRSAKGV